MNVLYVCKSYPNEAMLASDVRCNNYIAHLSQKGRLNLTVAVLGSANITPEYAVVPDNVSIVELNYSRNVWTSFCSYIKKTPREVSFNSQTLLLKSLKTCLLYTSPSPRDRTRSRMPSSA